MYFLAAEPVTPRWEQQDAPDFKAALKRLAPGLSVTVEDANDAATQQSQVEAAITANAKAIVLVTVDQNATGKMLTDAAAAKIPVILYDHDASVGPATARVFYDFFQTGELQGQAIVQDASQPGGALASIQGRPIRLGRICCLGPGSISDAFISGQNAALRPLTSTHRLVFACDETMPPTATLATAQNQAEECLTRNHNHVDALMSLNDAFATAMIAAAKTTGAAPIHVYGGQDADVSGLQNIIRGVQPATVYKPFKAEAYVAARLVASLTSDGKMPALGSSVRTGPRAVGLKVGSEKDQGASFQTYQLTPLLLRKPQIGYTVVDGVYTWKEICAARDLRTAETCRAHGL